MKFDLENNPILWLAIVGVLGFAVTTADSFSGFVYCLGAGTIAIGALSAIVLLAQASERKKK